VSDVYALVRSIRAARYSRNRNFEAHRSAASVEARRVNRFLRAIERDLLAAERVTITSRGESFVVEMVFPAVRATRRVALSGEAMALLREDPRLADRLDARVSNFVGCP
jgi:hypothetical protein